MVVRLAASQEQDDRAAGEDHTGNRRRQGTAGAQTGALVRPMAARR